MAGTEVYSLSEAARRLRVSRKLVSYLIREHQIPCRQVGMCKTLDEAGFDRLRRVVAAHLAKPEPATA